MALEKVFFRQIYLHCRLFVVSRIMLGWAEAEVCLLYATHQTQYAIQLEIYVLFFSSSYILQLWLTKNANFKEIIWNPTNRFLSFDFQSHWMIWDENTWLWEQGCEIAEWLWIRLEEGY